MQAEEKMARKQYNCVGSHTTTIVLREGNIVTPVHIEKAEESVGTGSSNF
jgi:hypothetical protein